MSRKFTHAHFAGAFDKIVAYQGVAELQADHSPSLEDRLLDLGIAEADLCEAVEVIETDARHRAFRLCAEFVRWLSARLKKESAAGAALAKALGLAPEESCAELGEVFGHTKQAVGNAVALLRAQLPAHVAHATGAAEIARPEGEQWRTRVEAAKELEISAELLRLLGPREIEVGRRRFVDIDDARALLHARRVRQAAKSLRN